MESRDETIDDDDGRPSVRRYVLTLGAGALVLALLVVGVVLLLRGDNEPVRKVQDLTIVTILPPTPPPPPPPPPPQVKPEMVEQTPVKQEMIEEKPIEIPKNAPPKDSKDEPPPGALALGDKGTGPGDLFNLGGKPGGRGLLGGGGGGGGSSRWGWYASIVQSQIEAALRGNDKTRHAVMQIQVRLWSDESGRVSRVQLVASTGNSDLDAVIRDQVLKGLTLREPPPKDMPMPISLRVTARNPA